jgi:hypothetical protein
LLVEYKLSIVIALIFIACNVANRTVFSDKSVRAIKDHIEEGTGGAEDEFFNYKQEYRRTVCTKLMWFSVSAILISSIII